MIIIIISSSSSRSMAAIVKTVHQQLEHPHRCSIAPIRPLPPPSSPFLHSLLLCCLCPFHQARNHIRSCSRPLSHLCRLRASAEFVTLAQHEKEAAAAVLCSEALDESDSESDDDDAAVLQLQVSSVPWLKKAYTSNSFCCRR
jgi:hypothetical protein